MKVENKRGRPIGSGKNEDLAMMPKIADLMVQSKMSRTKAVHTIYPAAIADRSALRRVERKFKENHDEYISQAKTRVIETRRIEAENKRTKATLLAIGSLLLKPKDLADLLAAGKEFKKLRTAAVLPTKQTMAAFAEGKSQFDKATQFASGVSSAELEKGERFARGLN